MTNIIVEQSFDPPLTPEAFSLLASRLEPCLEDYGVTWIRGYHATDRRRVICHFEAADAGTVRSAFRSAGARFERVWTADIRSPEAVRAD